MKKNIVGIQQIGIGVPDVKDGFKWYRQHFGMDVPVFEEAAEANLMLPYTGGQPHKRHAILAINMKGGGGFEIWQYTSRVPQASKFKAQMGDLGLFCAKMKSDNVNASYNYLRAQGVKILGEISSDPLGKKHFFMEDPYGNLFEVREDDTWFGNGKQHTGGPVGMVIGVSNLQKSIQFYNNILGYDKLLYTGEDGYTD